MVLRGRITSFRLGRSTLTRHHKPRLVVPVEVSNMKYIGVVQPGGYPVYHYENGSIVVQGDLNHEVDSYASRYDFEEALGGFTFYPETAIT